MADLDPKLLERREQEALDWLKNYCGLHESEVVGDSITVIASHKGDRVGYWIVDAKGKKRRFKEMLATFAQSIREQMEIERDIWRRALNDLTPGGSEFANDAERCKQFVRDARESQHKAIIRFKQERDAIRDAERERCARVAENPYSDEVGALSTQQPFAIGERIAAAIREGKEGGK